MKNYLIVIFCGLTVLVFLFDIISLKLAMDKQVGKKIIRISHLLAIIFLISLIFEAVHKI